MEQEMREQLLELETLVPDIARIAARAYQEIRDQLEARGFTHDEAMRLLVAQAGSGESIVKVGG
jgi:hypothetical protein